MTAASVLAAISAVMLGPLPGRVQRRGEGQDDREPGPGPGCGEGIAGGCLAARNRRQPGEDTSGDGYGIPA